MARKSICCELTDGELFLVKGVDALDSETSPDAQRIREFLERVMCEDCRVRYAKLMRLNSPEELMRVIEMAA